MPQVIALNFTCLCKGEVIKPVPLLPAKSLITVTGCVPTHWSGSEGGWQGLWCRLPGQARWPQLCTPSPFPMAIGGLWGPTVSSHPHRGALRSPWASSPGKKARLCHQASAQSHSVGAGHVFSQRAEDFLQSIKTEPPLMV